MEQMAYCTFNAAAVELCEVTYRCNVCIAGSGGGGICICLPFQMCKIRRDEQQLVSDISGSV